MPFGFTHSDKKGYAGQKNKQCLVNTDRQSAAFSVKDGRSINYLQCEPVKTEKTQKLFIFGYVEVE